MNSKACDSPLFKVHIITFNERANFLFLSQNKQFVIYEYILICKRAINEVTRTQTA